MEANGDGSECIKCDSGFYSDVSTDNICTQCDNGNRVNDKGDGCINCSEYEYSGIESNWLCAECGENQGLREDRSGCDDCKANQYRDNMTNWKCVERENAKSRSSMFPWWIFLIVGLVVIITIVIIILFLIKRRKKKKEEEVENRKSEEIKPTESEESQISLIPGVTETKEQDWTEVKEGDGDGVLDSKLPEDRYGSNILFVHLSCGSNLMGFETPVIPKLSVDVEMPDLMNSIVGDTKFDVGDTTFDLGDTKFDMGDITLDLDGPQLGEINEGDLIDGLSFENFLDNL
jgi:preprotein translocase subunit YajC